MNASHFGASLRVVTSKIMRRRQRLFASGHGDATG
jgi:hypothetical protein